MGELGLRIKGGEGRSPILGLPLLPFRDVELTLLGRWRGEDVVTLILEFGGEQEQGPHGG